MPVTIVNLAGTRRLEPNFLIWSGGNVSASFFYVYTQFLPVLARPMHNMPNTNLGCKSSHLLWAYHAAVRRSNPGQISAIQLDIGQILQPWMAQVGLVVRMAAGTRHDWQNYKKARRPNSCRIEFLSVVE